MVLLGLTWHVESGVRIDPAAANAWRTSSEGVRFAMESSTAWGAAAVDGGADPAEAAAAVDRTTAAYTAT